MQLLLIIAHNDAKINFFREVITVSMCTEEFFCDYLAIMYNILNNYISDEYRIFKLSPYSLE